MIINEAVKNSKINDKIEVKRLLHLTHIEDNLLYGPDVAVLVLQFLRDMFEFLEGHTTKVRTSFKIDGAPSVMVASDFNGKYFVTTKAGEKKAATTPEECEEFFGGEDKNNKTDLVKKMKTLLKYAPAMNIPKNEIWQGDFLFIEDNLQINNIDGEDLVMFIANTIWYAFPLTDPIAQKILKSKMGIAFHTVYKGSTWDDLKISFDCDINRLQSHPEIYYMNTAIPSVAGIITMTAEETQKAKELLEKVFNKIQILCENPDFKNKYEEICLPYDKNDTSLPPEEKSKREITSKLLDKLLKYKNKLVREGVRDLGQPQLEDYIARYKKENEEKRATYTRPSDSRKNLEKEEKELSVIEYYYDLITLIWETQTVVSDLKDIFLTKMDPLITWKHFTQGKTTGFKPSGGEGFVVSDVAGNVMKIVSRMDFSRNNFSNEVIKGWTSDKREAQNQMKESTLKEALNSFNDLKKNIATNITLTFMNNGFSQKPEIKLSDGITKLNKPLFIDNKKIDFKCLILTDNREAFARELEDKGFIVGTKIGLSNLLNVPYKEISTINNSSDSCPIWLYEYEPNSFIACALKNRGSAASNTHNEETFFAILMWHILNNNGNFTYTQNGTTTTINLLRDNISLSEINLNDILGLESIKFTSGKPIISGNATIRGYIEEAKTLYNQYFINSSGEYTVSRLNLNFSGTGKISVKKSGGYHSMINNYAKMVKNKDSWNPSDVYIVKEGTNFLTDLKNCDLEENPQEAANRVLKNYLVGTETIEENSVVGISLKKHTSNSPIHIEEYNINRTEYDQYYDEDGFPEVEIKDHTIMYPLLDWSLSKKTKSKLKVNNRTNLKLSIIFKKTNSGAELSYRDFNPGTKSGFSIETVIIDSGVKSSDAQGGKIPSEFIEEILTNEEVLPKGKYIESLTSETNLFNTKAQPYVKYVMERNFDRNKIKLEENESTSLGNQFFSRMEDYLKIGEHLEDELNQNSSYEEIKETVKEDFNNEDTEPKDYETEEDIEEDFNEEILTKSKTEEVDTKKPFAEFWEDLTLAEKTESLERHKKEWAYWLTFLNILFTSSTCEEEIKFRRLLTYLVQFGQKRYKGAAPFIKVS